MHLWDALSGEAIGVPYRVHAESVTCVAISKDCKPFLSSSLDGTVRHREVSAERNITEQHILSAVPDEVRSYLIQRPIVSLSVCAIGMIALPGSLSGTVQRWDTLTGDAMGLPILGHAERSGCILLQ